MTFSYYLNPNYLGKISKVIQKYQVTNKGLLSQFENVKVIKGADVVEVNSWAVRNLPSF